LKFRKKNIEWHLALFALATIVVFWFVGKYSQKEKWDEKISEYYPDILYQKEQLSDGVWRLKGEDESFFLVKGEGKGFAGYIKLLILYNSDYQFKDVHVVSSSETPSYFKKVIRNDFFLHFRNQDSLTFVETYRKIDAVSGATKTCEGIIASVHSASSLLAKSQNMQPPADLVNKNLQFGMKELLVIFLLLLGIIGRLKKFPYKKYVLWTSLVLGLVFLGFVYGFPITLTRLNSFLLGYWPDWHSELYLYLLFFGVLAILLTTGKNIYCYTFCPFGALQEVLGKLGKANHASLNNRQLWSWLQRTTAWIAIILALVFRNPSISEYEVFGAAFHFTGSHWLFLLLAVVIVASLIIWKPWCSFFCPVKPAFAYIQLYMKKIHGLWVKK